MDGGLEDVGQVLILVGHRQGDGHRQRGGEILTGPLDRTEVDGSLKAVGVAHGESPYWSYGVHRVRFSRSARRSHPPGEILPRETIFLSPVSHLTSRTICRALRIIFLKGGFANDTQAVGRVRWMLISFA